MVIIQILLISFAFCACSKASPPSVVQILEQKRPESWPEWVDVAMNSSILADDSLKQQFKECFTQVPSLMLEISDKAVYFKKKIK